MLEFMIKKYGFENLSFMVIGLCVFLFIFLGLKAHKIYKFIPKSLIIGVKLMLMIFLVI